MMRRASRGRALRPKCIGQGGAVVRAALAILLSATVGLDAAMGESRGPNQPVSSRDAAIAESPAVSEGVAGVIVDESGAPITDVFVQVVPADSTAGPVPEIAITTDDRGGYEWPLPPGRYVVSIAPTGFAPQTEEVVVEPGRLGELNFVLERAQP